MEKRCKKDRQRALGEEVRGVQQRAEMETRSKRIVDGPARESSLFD